MKTTIIVSVLMLAGCWTLTAQNAHPGFRKMTAQEQNYLNGLRKVLYSSIPHTYKTWNSINDDGKDFNINDYWCKDPMPGDDCKGLCPESIGVGDPYSLNCIVDYKMPGEESSKLMASSYQMIKDFQNASQIAAALKSSAASKLTIRIFANIPGGDFDLSYCGKNPPVPIQLPIPSTLALKGLRSASCPIMQEGTKQADLHGDYYDRAIIFLGKAPATKKADDWSDGLSGTRYTVGFDHAKIGKTITQNIVVTITGDSADIEAAIALIDWKALAALISK